MGLPGEPGTSPPAPWLVADRVDITVTGLTIDASGAHVDFTLKDKDGKPLDRTGTLTEGAVSVSFVLAQLGVYGDGSPAQYTAYTKRTATAVPPFTGSAEQATTEGLEANFEVMNLTEGRYRYKFAASTAAYDSTLTQTVMARASRTIDGVRSWDRELFHVGSARREEVTNDACASCHNNFAMHGGSYTKAEQCILCHTAQTSDAETGNTVDFRVMIHKIHRGEDLPSYVADPTKPYQIAGFKSTSPFYTLHDWTEVAFPGPTTNLATNISRCTACHAPAAAQGTRWKTRPSIETCTSCHDTTIFTGTANPPFTVAHQGGLDPVLVNNSTCIVCHGETSGVAPIPAQHFLGPTNPNIGTLGFEIVSITNTSPGSLPTVRFKVLANGSARDLLTQPVNSLTATMMGPTTDYGEYWQARIQSISSTGAVTTSPNLVAVAGEPGVFDFTFPATVTTPPCTQSSLARDCNIPASATGSYVIAFEGNWTPAAGATRIVAQPAQLAFAVTGTKVDRRVIVDKALCNNCHYNLEFHGGNRKDANYCVACHNPNNANDERRSRVEGSTVFVEAVDFRVMIHKIHMGEELSQPYILGGNPSPSVSNPVGNQEDFGTIRYPRPRNECNACHVGTTYQLPMNRSTKYLPSTTVEMSCSEPVDFDGTAPDNYCDAPYWLVTTTNKIAPESSVCTSCHDAPYTAAHALVNVTTAGAEACTTCHGPGKEFDASKYHGMP